MTPKEQFRSNIILWLALLAGQLMIAFIFIFIVADKGESFMMPFKSKVSIFFYIGMVLMAGCIFMSNFMHQKKQAEIAGLSSFEDKLAHYRASFIVRAALIEGACLANLNFMFTDNNIAFFGIVAIGILFFLRTRPDVEQFKSEYNLTNEERSQL